MFTYVALHLVNHSLGLVSVAVAESALRWAVRVWHSPPGSVLLYGAAFLHLGLALDAIYTRRWPRLMSLDMLRLAFGFGIPVLLIGHIVGTRVAWELYSQPSQYSRVVWSLWIARDQGRQLALLVPGWAHGCLGIHLAASHLAWYRRWRRPLFAAALMLPALGAAGFFAMGKELAGNASIRAQLDAGLMLSDSGNMVLLHLRESLVAFYFIALATVFIARGFRSSLERRSRDSESSSNVH